MNNSEVSKAEALAIRKEQVYMLYKPSLHEIVSTLAVILLLSYAQWSFIEHSIIITWACYSILIIAARMAFYFAFDKKQPDTPHIPFWEISCTALAAGSGVSWGAAGILLFSPDNWESQAITMVALIGISAGAIINLSILRLPVIIFTSLTILPLIINLLVGNATLPTSITILLTIYFLFLINASKFIHNTHLRSITFRIQSLANEKAMHETSRILEMIATGVPASDIYDAIALHYESQNPGLRCSLLELHGNKLARGGSPSLPKAYCEAVEGLENGLNVGSCGTSTYTGKRVLVEDISTDPKWVGFKDLALAHNLHCCWSEPIKDKSGKVLGAFGMYDDHPALPTEKQLADLEAGARLAGIVMERQQHEVLLEKLYSAFECAEDAIMITDLEARIEYVNPSFEKMTGYSAQTSIGLFTTILRSTKHSEQFYIDFYNQCISGKPWQGEITIRCKDGSLLDTERNVSPVFDEEGNIAFFVAIMRDLTEKKLLESQFQQAQKMEAVGTLVGGIAHDFNNILAGITGNLYLAQTQVESESVVAEKLHRIETLSARAADLIQQMLTFARKDTVSMDKLSLTPLVKEVYKFLSTSIPENIEINFDAAHDINIHGDATQIHQMLLNLVNNARDAVEYKNQPKISIKLEAIHADKAYIEKQRYLKEGDYAHLSVSDNGIGIPEHNIEHLFEPFFTTKEVGKGTGLGLSMVFGAIKRHKGFIEVESTEHQGSTFHVYLPALTEETLLQATDQEHLSLNAGNKEVILLVDDEEEVLEMGTEVLKTLGYTVLQARNGQEAIDIFTSHQNDIALILTDLVMPKLGGAEAIEKIRSINPNIKVIFSTGYDKNTALTNLTITEDDILLSKPYSIEELNNLIAQQLH